MSYLLILKFLAPADGIEVATGVHLPKDITDSDRNIPLNRKYFLSVFFSFCLPLKSDHIQVNNPTEPVTSDTSGDGQVDTVDDGPGETAVYTSHFTPLETSLLYCLEDPTTTTPELIGDIAEDNNPRRVLSEKDKAAYWVKNDGSPLMLSFPAILDTQGKYGRTGPYFNMIENVSALPYDIYIFPVIELRPSSPMRPISREPKPSLN